jgi:predicted AAA+ superfamily ATPase
MEKPDITQLLTKLDKLLDRYVDSGPETPYFDGYRAFLWDGKRKSINPIRRPVWIDVGDLIGVDSIKKEVIRNTKNFVDGGKANNVLLWGERGTGKSSLLKSLLTVFDNTPLRMIQIYKHDILTIQEMYDLLERSAPYRFILLIDDLSFEEGQTDYKEMKTIMDGGVISNSYCNYTRNIATSPVINTIISDTRRTNPLYFSKISFSALLSQFLSNLVQPKVSSALNQVLFHPLGDTLLSCPA